MSALIEPEIPALQPAAVELLTAIRDHLDLPPYAEGDKQARRAWRNLLEVRHADVVAALNELLAVPVTDALDYAAHLRRVAAEEQALAPYTAGGGA